MKTTSLELSQRMKEKGWNTPTDSVWAGNNENDVTIYTGIKWRVPGTFPKIWVPAPTSDDLLDVLPEDIEINEQGMLLHMTKYCAVYTFGYTYNQAFKVYGEDSNPAEALGNLWCELKERNLI